MPAHHRFRLAALAVTGFCVLTLAAGVFAVSYPGARDIAITAGVPGNLARIYPGIFDAVLLVACAAAFSLRGLLRGYAWLTILVVMVALAGADTAHAMTVKLPIRPLEATAAIVPWAVLLIGLTLLYAMARQWRPGHYVLPPAATGHGQGPPGALAANGGAAPGNRAAVVPLSTLLAGRSAAAAAPAQSRPATSGRGDVAAEQGQAATQADRLPKPAEPAPPVPPAELHSAPAD